MLVVAFWGIRLGLAACIGCDMITDIVFGVGVVDGVYLGILFLLMLLLAMVCGAGRFLVSWKVKVCSRKVGLKYFGEMRN
jgi:hypothetical protein